MCVTKLYTCNVKSTLSEELGGRWAPETREYFHLILPFFLGSGSPQQQEAAGGEERQELQLGLQQEDRQEVARQEGQERERQELDLPLKVR
jgi:hypothetical protein